MPCRAIVKEEKGRWFLLNHKPDRKTKKRNDEKKDQTPETFG